MFNPRFPTIYEHEKHGKTEEEDRATSALIGHIGELREDLRAEFLVEIGLLHREQASAVTGASLWYRLRSKGGRRQRWVDVVLQIGESVLLIENKLASPIDTKQLVDEFRFAKNEFANATLAMITDHPRRPAELREAEKRIGAGATIKWTSWEKCLKVSRKMADTPNTDVSSKRSLLQLADFLEGKGFASSPGFSADDDWATFARLVENLDEVIDRTKEILKKRGLKNFTRQMMAKSGNAVQSGIWAYRNSSQYGEWGCWFAVGMVEGENKIELAIYEHKKHRRFAYLEKKGYARDIKWQDEVFSGDYVYYSNYLSIRNLEGETIKDQLLDIEEFLKKCLRQVPELAEQTRKNKD